MQQLQVNMKESHDTDHKDQAEDFQSQQSQEPVLEKQGSAILRHQTPLC